MAKPYVRITEQPAEKSYRFRYKSEGRLNGSIPGANSTPQKSTYPAIEIGNFTGIAEIHISCVTHNDKPPRQHPHNLIAGKGTNESIMKVNVNQKKVVEFKDIGIVCVKKEEIVKSLEVRKKQNIDPTKGGWHHMISPYTSIDLRRVRLCFDVEYLEKDNTWKHLGYAISNAIIDKKSNGQLKIIDISSKRSTVNGGKRIILLCDKVKREDISVIFYEEDNDRKVIWREEINYKNSTTMRVHHQYAISFNTPEYKEFDIRETRKVFIQLYRPSDSEVGDPVDFEFIPNPQSTRLIHKKKKRMSERSREILESISNLKKAEKSKYAQEDVLTPTNGTNAVECSVNPQPLIEIATDVKEEIEVPSHNFTHNQFQQTTNGQHPYQRQMTNANLFDEPYNSYQSNYPQYYYNSYTQSNNYFGEPSHTPYNPEHILVPFTSQQPYQETYQLKQEPQKQQQYHIQPQPSTTSNAFKSGHQYGRYMDQPTTSSALPSTSSNPIAYATNNVPVTNDLLAINDLPEYDSNLFDINTDINTDINELSENLDSMKISTYDN